MSEWRDLRLGELVASAGGSIRTGPFGSQLHAGEYTDDRCGVPVVMPKDMVDGRVARATVSRVDEQTAQRLKVHRLESGDLVLARRGDVGRYAFVEADEAGWLCGTGAIRVHAPESNVVWPRFLRYAMAHPQVAAWLVGRAVGATMPNLNSAIVARIPLRIPDVSTQRRIAVMLGAFDELIEINQRRIELLENLARSLYSEWFVRLRFPGAAATSADRLPDGWRTSTLGELCDVVRGRSYRRDEISETAGVAFLNLKCIRRGGGFRRDGLKRYTGSFKDTQRIRAGDVLVAVTDMTQERRIVAQAFRMPELDRSPAVPSLDLAVVRPRAADLRSYVYAFLRYSDFGDRVRHFANGANVLHLAVERILEAALAVPDDRTLRKFTVGVEAFLLEIEFLERANPRLVAARDLLLSRLVRGRLDISGIDLEGLVPAGAA
jgi:type I restriction enzyme S subunit